MREWFIFAPALCKSLKIPDVTNAEFEAAIKSALSSLKSA
jgi:hypothetical protein